jgi:hypothetical protein
MIGSGAGPLRPIAIGAIAQAALIRSGGAARVLARSTASAYIAAGDQVAWLGTSPPFLHPRAIVVPDTRVGALDHLHVTTEGLSPWIPRTARLDAAAARALVVGWSRLVRNVRRLGPPVGFGALLVGRTPEWPLGTVAGAAEGLARACADDDATAATIASTALLGVGGGLTPSGDDFVGGALFARWLLALAGIDRDGWRCATDTILRAACERTHPISAALLGDLAGGTSWAALHDLVAALPSDEEGAVHSARRLVRLGHSSGWDLLAGFGAGLGSLT